MKAVLSLVLAATLLQSPVYARSIMVVLPVTQRPTVGRLVIYLLKGTPSQNPADGVFYNPPRPIFGADVTKPSPGRRVVIDDQVDAYPDKLSRLPDGDYTMQAVLVCNRTVSDWRKDDGNWFSKPQVVEFKGQDDRPEITLDQPTHAPEVPTLPPGLELVSIRSKLLSDFLGHDVMLNATVRPPRDAEPGRQYPALYHVPGYGGRHWDGVAAAQKRLKSPTTQPATVTLERSCYDVFLDPETPTGHSLFCDSDVNGPWGAALTTELIPALEHKYPLIPQPMARLLRGHSSGGWSTIWLTTQYPDVFAATWATSPDPISFHRFVTGDLYEDGFYSRPESNGLLPSFRKDNVILHIADEVRMEAVVGPGNTSGEQWASWCSCWGERDTAGHAVLPWDVTTGKVDRRRADAFRRFDVLERLRADPDRYVPIFKQRIRLVVGGADNFYLNEAVELLDRDLRERPEQKWPEGRHGYVKVVPGLGHSTLFSSSELAAFPAEMVEHLRAHGWLTADE